MSVSVCARVCARLGVFVCVCGCCTVCPALLGSVAYFLCVFIYLRRFAISKSVRVLPQTKMARFGLTSRSSCLCPGRVWSGLSRSGLAGPGRRSISCCAGSCVFLCLILQSEHNKYLTLHKSLKSCQKKRQHHFACLPACLPAVHNVFMLYSSYFEYLGVA